MAQKKIPMRMCVGCREMHPKKELIRVVCSNAGEIKVDHGGKAAGRGAYICNAVECLNKAIKTRALERALEHKISEDVFAQLKEDVSASGPE